MTQAATITCATGRCPVCGRETRLRRSGRPWVHQECLPRWEAYLDEHRPLTEQLERELVASRFVNATDLFRREFRRRIGLG